MRLLRTWIFVDIESMVQLLYSHGLATRRPARYARNSRLALITGGINRSTELPDHPPSHIHSALRIRFPVATRPRKCSTPSATERLPQCMYCTPPPSRVQGIRCRKSLRVYLVCENTNRKPFRSSKGLDISFRSRAKRRRASSSNRVRSSYSALRVVAARESIRVY